MRWIFLFILFSCSSQNSERWCAHPSNKFKQCFKTEEKCMDAQAQNQTGVTCRPAEML